MSRRHDTSGNKTLNFGATRFDVPQDEAFGDLGEDVEDLLQQGFAAVVDHGPPVSFQNATKDTSRRPKKRKSKRGNSMGGVRIVDLYVGTIESHLSVYNVEERVWQATSRGAHQGAEVQSRSPEAGVLDCHPFKTSQINSQM